MKTDGGEPRCISNAILGSNTNLGIEVDPQSLTFNLKVGVDNADASLHIGVEKLSVETPQIVKVEYVGRGYKACVRP